MMVTDFRLRDIAWPPTLRLAAGRSLASTLVLGTAFLILGGAKGATMMGIVRGSAAIWSEMLIGAPLAYLLMRAMRGVFERTIGFAWVIDLMAGATALAIAIGDPIIWAINLRWPAVFELADFNPINFRIWIAVLDTPESRAARADSRARRAASPRPPPQTQTRTETPSAPQSEARQDRPVFEPSTPSSSGAVPEVGMFAWTAAGFALVGAVLVGRMTLQDLARADPPAAPVLVFASRDTNERGAPSQIGTRVLKTLRRGDAVVGRWVPATEGSGRWLQVTGPAGQTGFLPGAALEPERRPPLVKIISRRLAVTSPTYAYSRTTARDVDRPLSLGEVVQVIGDVGGGWYEVATPVGGVAYVPSAALSAT